jgi:hypothetical protein
MMPAKSCKPTVILLRVDRVDELFQTLDPTPFRGRDVDPRAEEYIVSSARELPRQAPIRIVIHMPASEAASERAPVVGQAMRQYFRYRAEMVSRDIAERLRVGRRALLMGLLILALGFSMGQLVRKLLPGQFGAMIAEGLIILGWVANWRPMEAFLYDWGPLARDRNLLRRLADADIVIAPRDLAPLA